MCMQFGHTKCIHMTNMLQTINKKSFNIADLPYIFLDLRG